MFSDFKVSRLMYLRFVQLVVLGVTVCLWVMLLVEAKRTKDKDGAIFFGGRILLDYQEC